MSASSIPSSPADLALIEQLRNELLLAKLQIEVLEERLRLQRIKKYGQGSEKLSDAQLELLELELGVSNLEVKAESQREPLPRSCEQRSRRPHPGRQSLPVHLPRVERVLHCTPEQETCQRCGKGTVVIGYDESERLDVEPAKYFVEVRKREKRVCPDCEEEGVKAAPLPPQIIDKGLASNQVVIHTVVQKYCDHLPLYRQSAILQRDTGLEVSRATLDGWVLTVGELLIPLSRAMRMELLRGGYIQADETPVPLQTQDGREKHQQAYLWQYGRPGGGVVFDFRLSRGRDGPKEFLGKFDGILQTDGYAAYDHVGGPNLVHAACWAHVAIHFRKVLELNPRDPLARPIVEHIRDLFAIDSESWQRGLSLEARQALRVENARPLLDAIRKQIETARAMALPASALGKACQYTLRLWEKLTRFLEYPKLELSNNPAENSMRPVAVGRKNWIHVGSAQAGPKIAAILSVMESCRRLKISVRDYLNAILPGIADVPISRLPELTPSTWALRR